MGCSSGLLQRTGQYEPYGVPISYLITGSPCIVANLWDVTDRDIDAYTVHLLNLWLSEKSSLVNCVGQSRDICKLQYIVGAAPIYYGLPVQLNNSVWSFNQPSSSSSSSKLIKPKRKQKQ